MNKIFELSTGITEMSVLRQKKSKGGFDMTLSQSTVFLSGPGGGGDSWDFPSSFGDGPGGPGDGGGGTGGGTDPGTDPGDNVNDPTGALDSARTQLTEQMEGLKELLNGDLLSAEDKEDAQEVIDALQQTLDTIELIENSDNKYRIDVVEDMDGDPTKASGEFSYDNATGEYVITVEGVNGQYASTFAHELEHANQLENGELYLGSDGTIQGYDINDEVDAYDAQHKIDKGVFFDTTDLNGNPVDGNYEVTSDEIYNAYPGVYDHFKNDDSGGDIEFSEPSSTSHP